MTLASKTAGWLPIAICLLSMAAAPLLGRVKQQIREGRPIVDGIYVNGHGPYLFLIDTGTNVNLIETRLAKSIGMNSAFQVDFASSVGKTLLQGSDGNEVQVDSVKATRQEFLYSELNVIHDLLPDVQGVLGQWFLSGFDYMLDLHAKRLEFGKQDRDGTRARFTMPNGRTAVSTSLGYLALDSGAARLVLFGVDPDRRNQGYIRTFAGSQTIGMVSSKLVIEGRKIWHGDAVAIPSRTEPGVAGLMPLSLFKTIYVCNSEGYVVFE